MKLEAVHLLRKIMPKWITYLAARKPTVVAIICYLLLVLVLILGEPDADNGRAAITDWAWWIITVSLFFVLVIFALIAIVRFCVDQSAQRKASWIAHERSFRARLAKIEIVVHDVLWSGRDLKIVASFQDVDGRFRNAHTREMAAENPSGQVAKTLSDIGLPKVSLLTRIAFAIFTIRWGDPPCFLICRSEKGNWVAIEKESLLSSAVNLIPLTEKSAKDIFGNRPGKYQQLFGTPESG